MTNILIYFRTGILAQKRENLVERMQIVAAQKRLEAKRKLEAEITKNAARKEILRLIDETEPIFDFGQPLLMDTVDKPTSETSTASPVKKDEKMIQINIPINIGGPVVFATPKESPNVLDVAQTMKKQTFSGTMFDADLPPYLA